MTKANLLALAARCEAATGADRELDLDVALAGGLISKPVERGCWVDPGECIDGDKEPGSGTFVAPAYSASLDAAMTLVPEGWRVWAVREDETGWWCGLSPDGGNVVVGGWAPTPSFALALTAACLRAIAEEMPDV